MVAETAHARYRALTRRASPPDASNAVNAEETRYHCVPPAIVARSRSYGFGILQFMISGDSSGIVTPRGRGSAARAFGSSRIVAPCPQRRSDRLAASAAAASIQIGRPVRPLARPVCRHIHHVQGVGDAATRSLAAQTCWLAKGHRSRREQRVDRRLVEGGRGQLLRPDERRRQRRQHPVDPHPPTGALASPARLLAEFGAKGRRQ